MKGVSKIDSINQFNPIRRKGRFFQQNPGLELSERSIKWLDSFIFAMLFECPLGEDVHR